MTVVSKYPTVGDIMKVAKDLVVSLAYQVRTEDRDWETM